jgi:hypothetical protein
MLRDTQFGILFLYKFPSLKCFCCCVEEENYDSPGSAYFFFRQQLLIKEKFSPKSQKPSVEEDSPAQTGSADFEKN